MAVVIETTKGIFTVDLYVEQRPKVCKNFLKLCKAKFYNASLFHSVQPHFIAQAGCPAAGNRGDQGESIYRRIYGDQARFFEGDSGAKIKHGKVGLLSMAGAGNNTFGSQFFVTLEDDLNYLDAEHCAFGEISEGLDGIVATLNETICDREHRPYQDLRITHTVVLDDPFDDPPTFEPPSRSPTPSMEMLATTRIAADEDLEEDDLDEQQLAEKEAKARATILEMVGDLPAADCAPPENVLFVCKLNPVTTDEDLEIIFSRFGKVVSCEVIKDRKTNDSLQYAFVEFDEQKACEAAYFKMDNVLIDDRRIHVDFSQSVSKFRWKGKGRLEVVEKNDDDDDREGRVREKRRRRESPAAKSSKHRRRSRSRSRSRHRHEYGSRRRRSPARRHGRRRSRSPSSSRRRFEGSQGKRSSRRR